MNNPAVSIVIPTRNGDPFIGQCLKSVFAQKSSLDFEVIVIDSGSSDKTLDIVRGFPVTMVEIEPHEFGHGKTRNQGASLARGEYLVYLTQDAVPVDEHWLETLVQSVLQDARVAGAYSRWIPRADCGIPEARWINERFGPIREVKRLGRLVESDYLGHMERLVLFSDVSSCLRKTVWTGIPFDEGLIFGEDQQWSRMALEAGHTIIYEPESIVYHSHRESLTQRFRRSFDVGMSMKDNRGASASLLRILPGSLLETAKDCRFARNAPLRRRVRLPLQSFCSHATDGTAWWLGVHHRHLPLPIKRRLSTVPHLIRSADAMVSGRSSR